MKVSGAWPHFGARRPNIQRERIMSRVYIMNASDTKTKDRVLAKKEGKLSVVHRPIDSDGKDSLWPYGITDGKNYGWFEKDMILFWGSNDETGILRELEALGVFVTDAF